MRVLETIAAWRGYSRRLQVDNGSELISQRTASWGEKSDVPLDFIKPEVISKDLKKRGVQLCWANYRLP